MRFGTLLLGSAFLLPTISSAAPARSELVRSLKLESGRTLQVLANRKSGAVALSLLDAKSAILDRRSLADVKSRKPSVDLAKLPSFENDVQLISLVLSPTADEGEISADTHRVFAIRRDKIEPGPVFDSIGQGEGGALRKFDFSRLKKDRQIRILLGLSSDELQLHPGIAVVGQDQGVDGPLSLVVEETHTWKDGHFVKKIEVAE